MSLSGPGLAVPASPRVPEQFPPSAFTLTTLLELRSLSFSTAQLENALKYFCVCVTVACLVTVVIEHVPPFLQGAVGESVCS